ncbi:phosphotransferase [Phenylobacterium montanum]|uniref:Phosphotransferase n=1 Tax=Phenylobacterium montanum TaxID=2823693 RepID=A0A975IWS9_9CAUL|nr:phosphotransferase [Caulobacter sp. S6]QUD89909.1 phosphotransferase [Caulobacter sp. S6]
METTRLPAGPDALDADWLTGALRESGALPAGRVTEIAITPVGNGLVADSFRLTLAYEGAAQDAPASIVGKFPARDAVSRQSGSAHRLYLREVSFYRSLAASLAIFTPHAYFAEIDPATDDFVLLMEDLGPARQGDQLHGCTLADAKTAMAEAAAMHAPRWADPTLLHLDWLVPSPDLAQQVETALPAITGMFKARYEGVLEPEFVDLVDRLPAALARQRGDTSSPVTVQHGDYRLDNILFDVQGGRRPMATLDWQTVTLGPAVQDVAYFLSAALDPHERRQHETELVRFYHGELIRRGVQGFSWEDCWRDYRRYSLHGILMGVFSALSVERTERGDALFLKMTRGACAQALDHQSFAFWEG